MNFKISLYYTVAIAAFFLMTHSLSLGQAPQNSTGPAARDVAIRFDQEKTTHHFRLLPEGGAIEVTANDPSDNVSRDAIRKRIAKIAVMFERGDFNIPPFVSGREAPGAETMQRLKSTISYIVENLPTGGRVHVTTADSVGLKAVHDFLRFQIQELKTGDSIVDPVAPKRPHPANNLGHDARPGPP